MKHLEIIESIKKLNNKIDQLEGFVSRIEDDSPTCLTGDDRKEEDPLSMSQFLSGGGRVLIEHLNDRVDHIHKKLSDLLEGTRDIVIDKPEK